MTKIAMNEESIEISIESPGAYLAELREQRGFTQDNVASRLHLRVQVIHALECDDFQQMPEPVFIKGYLRAYAKLLDIDPEPILSRFHSLLGVEEPRLEKALWQSRRQANKSIKTIRWLTLLFFVILMIAASIWWQKSKAADQSYSPQTAHNDIQLREAHIGAQVADISKMQSIIAAKSESKSVEKLRG